MDGRPEQSEPLGGLLALLGALFEEDIRAVYVRGGLSSFQSVLTSQFVLIPHDGVIPGVLTTGDLCDVAAALAPRPLRLAGIVDGLNRRLTADQTRLTYAPALPVYRAAGHQKRLAITDGGDSPTDWLRAQLRNTGTPR
jgi:hypothetical protein